MAINNLVDYWSQESTLLNTARGDAQTDLGAAQVSLAAAKAQLAADLAEFDAVKAQIAERRAQLANSNVPMEAEALTVQIRDLIVRSRALQGDVLFGQARVDTEQIRADVAAENLARLTAAHTAAMQAKGTAQADAVGRSAVKTKLGQAPLSTVKAEATAAAAGAAATDAADQLKTKDFPTPLFELAEKRYKARADHLVALRTSADEALGKSGDKAAATNGLDGVAAKAKLAFVKADAAVRDYAATARQRLDNAKAVIAALAAIKADPAKDFLTTDELTKVQTNTERTAAAAAADPVTAARTNVEAKRAALETALLSSIGTDVDGIASDAAVGSARNNLTTAEAALTMAVNTFVASAPERRSLDEWQALYQDSIWQRLLEYFDAKATLDELAGITATGAGSLVKAMDDAEKAYAVALADDAKARRSLDALNDQIAMRDKRRAAAATMTSKSLSAIRGDSF